MKDVRYLQLHKKYFLLFSSKIDNDIYQRIIALPNCDEALQLEEKIEIAIQNEINQLTPN